MFTRWSLLGAPIVSPLSPNTYGAINQPQEAIIPPGPTKGDCCWAVVIFSGPNTPRTGPVTLFGMLGSKATQLPDAEGGFRAGPG